MGDLTIQTVFGISKATRKLSKQEICDFNKRVLQTFLIRSDSERDTMETERWWFFYENLFPAEYRMSPGAFGRLCRKYREKGNFTVTLNKVHLQADDDTQIEGRIDHRGTISQNQKWCWTHCRGINFTPTGASVRNLADMLGRDSITLERQSFEELYQINQRQSQQ